MSFIRSRKINWNKFFSSMVACDPYGLAYLPAEAFYTPQVAAKSASQVAA